MYKGYTLNICSDLMSGSNFIVQARGGGGNLIIYRNNIVMANNLGKRWFYNCTSFLSGLPDFKDVFVYLDQF